jgi:hypothetical protein
MKNTLFCLMILLALTSCSEKGKTTNAETKKSDSTAQVREDSTDAAEAKDTKEVLDVVKK